MSETATAWCVFAPLEGWQVTGVHSCGQPSPGEFISLSVEKNRPAASSLDGDAELSSVGSTAKAPELPCVTGGLPPLHPSPVP